MTEPSGPQPLRLALWIAFAGHVLVFLAAVTDAMPPNTAILTAIACSIIGLAALTEVAPAGPRAQGAITVLTGAHVVAAAIMLSGLAPAVPLLLPLVALAAAALLGAVGLATLARSSTVSPPRPLTLAPRVAAICLVIQALLQRWADSATSPSLRTAILFSITALCVALLASMSVIALRVRRWALVGLLTWTVGWVSITADLSALILWSLGGTFPTGPHQLRQLDPELVQLLTTAGGLVIGAALVTSIRDLRFRHSAVVLLAGYAIFGVIAAITEHRIDLAADFPTIVALRKNRDLAEAIIAFALASVFWLYWRRAAAAARLGLPRATTRWSGD